MTNQRRSRSVAIFDLDHGILRKPPAELLGSSLTQRAADVLGPLGGPILKAFTRGASGSNGQSEAGQTAADKLQLHRHAPTIFEEHRQANRRLVATTHVPIEVAQPFADRLGFEAVIATTKDGPLVWGRGKVDAVRAWAKDNGAVLKRSYFYGGAFADAAMLAEVGRPVVVDPDPRLAALAWLKGWPTRSLHAPPGVLTVAGREMQELMRPFGRPELVPNAKIEFHDLHHIPMDGPAIVVGNHRSYYDGVVVGMAIMQSGRIARFLGKKEVFDVPVVGKAARWAGGIRVERGTGSDEPLHEAAAALEAGEVIMLMPEGTIPRGPAFFEPGLQGRWGAAKLAAMTKAPVIPLGLWGTEKVWPRSSRVPNLNPLNRPEVTVHAGPPVQLSYGDPDTDTKAIMSAIVDLLPDEAKVEHEPTAEELRLTYPAGYKGDPEKELARRPGTDT
ncbi:MAG: 1-acyl-sn-glycerol-3-phosphate acyltransferase [Actinomycetota bacterium]